MTAEYKKILAIRNNSLAIRRGLLTSFDNADICAFTKEVTGEKVLVISNPRNKVINYTVPAALVNTTWKDLVKGGSITLTSSMTLQAYSYLVAKQ